MGRQTKSELRRVLRSRNIKPSRLLGQNFLIDHNILGLIAEEAKVSREDFVLEVGAGTGLLSAYLAERAGWLTSIEIDCRLCEIWREFLSAYPNAEIINADILGSKHCLNNEVKRRVWEKFHQLRLSKFKCVSNLPYSIATSTIVALLEEGVELLLVTVQKELAIKIASSDGSREYGLISAVVQLLGKPQVIRIIPRTVFYPRPRVDACLLRVERKTPPPLYRSAKTIASHLFRYRRKTIARALTISMGLPGKSLCAEAGIPPSLRAGSLSSDSLLRLTQALEERYAEHIRAGYLAGF